MFSVFPGVWACITGRQVASTARAAIGILMDSPVFPNILSDRLTGYHLEMRELLLSVATRDNRYLEDIQERRVRPSAESIHGLDQFVEPFPEGPTSPEDVLDLLDDFGSPG